MKSFITVLGIAILFSAAAGKNFNLSLESSDELFETEFNDQKPKAMFARTENKQTVIKNLKSGDIFQMSEWKDDKFLFLHFDGKHFFYLNLSIKDSVPSREYKNLYVTKIGNVKSLL